MNTRVMYLLELWFSLCLCLWVQMFKLDLETAEGPDIKLPISIGLLRKQESSRKTPTSSLLTMPKPLNVWITTNGGKFLKRWEYQATWPASWKICVQVKKKQFELDMEEQTHLVPNWETSTSGCILSPYIFNIYAE